MTYHPQEFEAAGADERAGRARPFRPAIHLA